MPSYTMYTLKLTFTHYKPLTYKMNLVAALKIFGQLCYLFFAINQIRFHVRPKQLKRKHEDEVKMYEIEQENKRLRNKIEEQEAQIHYMSCHS